MTIFKFFVTNIIFDEENDQYSLFYFKKINIYFLYLKFWNHIFKTSLLNSKLKFRLVNLTVKS